MTKNDDTPIFPHYMIDARIATRIRPIQKAFDRFIEELDDEILELFPAQGEFESDDAYDGRMQVYSTELMKGALRALHITITPS